MVLNKLNKKFSVIVVVFKLWLSTDAEVKPLDYGHSETVTPKDDIKQKERIFNAEAI